MTMRYRGEQIISAEEQEARANRGDLLFSQDFPGHILQVS